MGDLAALPSAQPAPAPGPPVVSAGRPAAIAHAVVLLGAGMFLLLECGRQWFIGDEWDFLAQREVRLSLSTAPPYGLLEPHNEHLSLVPMLIWRGLFSLLGAGHYVLYCIPLVVATLGVVHVLWRLLLRTGCDPWVATGTTAVVAVLGEGWEDSTWAFQLGFLLSLLTGLLAVSQTADGRPVAAAMVGCLAVGSSNIGLVLVAAVVLITLIQRKPARALVGAGIPLALFLAWYVYVGHLGQRGDRVGVGLLGRLLPNYVWVGLTHTTSSLGAGVPGIGPVLVVVLGVALLAAVSGRFPASQVPAALALAAVALYVLTGIGRVQFGVDQARASRYTLVAAALVLPLLAQCVGVAVRSITGGRLVLAAVLLPLLVVQVMVLNDRAAARATQTQTDRWQVMAAVQLQVQGTVPTSFYASTYEGIPADRFLVLHRQGRLPVRDLTAQDLAVERVLLASGLRPTTAGTASRTACEMAQVGQRLLVSGGSGTVLGLPDRQPSALRITALGLTGDPSVTVAAPGSEQHELALPGSPWALGVTLLSGPQRVCGVP